MAYSLAMHTVVETPPYLKVAETIFSQSERLDIVSMLAADPKAGDVMPGTGGFRKLRVGRAGMGKRGGARLIYIVRGPDFPLFLIMVYTKNERANLTQQERNVLATRADDMFSRYGSQG